MSSIISPLPCWGRLPYSPQPPDQTSNIGAPKEQELTLNRTSVRYTNPTNTNPTSAGIPCIQSIFTLAVNAP